MAYGLVVVATFLLNRRAFGPSVAAWGLVPLAFASTGTIWLSGRVTGGHLLAAAWHAGAFALLWGCLTTGRAGGDRRRWGSGAGSGSIRLDVRRDLGGLAGRPGGRPRLVGPRGRAAGSDRRPGRLPAGFALAAGLGVAPPVIGGRVDPHDAYAGQFEPVTRGDVAGAERPDPGCWTACPGWSPAIACPGSRPSPTRRGWPGGPAAPRRGGRRLARRWRSRSVVARACSPGRCWPWLAIRAGRSRPDRPGGRSAGACWRRPWRSWRGSWSTGRITNSDNYRYLVFLLVPWSSGFGLVMAAARRRGGRAAGWPGLLALGFAGADDGRLGPVVRSARLDRRGRPAGPEGRSTTRRWSGSTATPRSTPILGDYWDVYRLSFLTGGRVRGVPFPRYPDRFPEIAPGLPGGRPRS